MKFENLTHLKCNLTSNLKNATLKIFLRIFSERIKHDNCACVEKN